MTITAPVETAPFTLEHFVAWSSEIVLDNDEPWVLEPFQLAFVEDLFSGRSACWLVIPEGNGKSTLIAGLALYFCEFKPFASVLAAAASREQAGVIYRQAEGMVLRTSRLHGEVVSDVLVRKGKRTTLAPRFDCLEGYRRINHAGGARLQVMAADEATGDGVVPSLCLVDELHRHRSMGLYRTWLGKLRKRGGQMIVISTAGEPGGEFEETRKQMRTQAPEIERVGPHVRAAAETWVLHDWAVAEDQDPEDLEVVAAANPLSWVTIESLEDKFKLPGMTMAHWRRFTCNQPTREVSSAITEAEWLGAVCLDEIPVGEPVWLGLDLGWKIDTTAMVPLWVRDQEFRLFGPATVLTPPRNGSMLDPHLVEDAILAVHERNPIEMVVMDMTGGAQLAQWLEETLGCEVIDRSQTIPFKVMDYARFTEALRAGWLWHAGDEGLTRHVMNATARQLPGGDIVFDRPHESRRGGAQLQEARVIDALVAAAMVHTSACQVEDAPLIAWSFV